jgi:CHAT domain-containing protein
MAQRLCLSGPQWDRCTLNFNLFLQRAAALEAQGQGPVYPQYEWYLQQTRVTVEQFKTAELRDYFGDECVAAARPGVTALERVSPDAVIVSPVLLPDRTELLVSLPTGLKRVVVPVPGPQLEQRVQIFRNALDDRAPQRYLQHAQRLYAWLIQPLEADLVAWQIQTIVFVPDGALRLLPLAALYDGQHFLIEKYAVAITPSLTLTEPRPLSRDKGQVLAAGMAGAVGELPPLPRVPDELRSLQRLYGGTVLLDQDFAPQRLEQTVRQGRFGIVHIAAHGHFAPEAAQSFLLTAQGKLTLEQLAQMVGRLRFRDQPLELLTLSACETARGDDRAALGLAGIAIQAGARSALATLWLVADDAAAVLMQAFYRHLQEPGVSRARALQLAQKALLQDPQYAEPFFWAPFLLINNWL